MTTETFTLLSDDDATHDALVKAFKTRFPAIAVAQYKRVLQASTRHFAQHLAKRQRIEMLQAKKRDWQYLVSDTERDIRHGNVVYSKEQLEPCEDAKAKIAQANADILALRDAPQTPTINPETLVEFVIIDSKGKFRDASVTVTLPKSQNVLDAIAASRATQDDLRSHNGKIRSEPLPMDDAVKRLIADVTANAEGPNIAPVTRLMPHLVDYVSRTGRAMPDAQGHMEWPVRGLTTEGGHHVEFDSGNRLLCWLFRDQIVEKGKAELAKLYQGRKGLSVAERERLLAENDAAILAEQRKEEALISMAEDQNIPILRRPLMNPLAILCVAPA